MNNMEEYKINLLKLAAAHDIREDLFWNESLDFFVVCSDFFCWGVADLTGIYSQADVDLLKQAIVDCEAAKQLGSVYAALLYCARKAQMRPQGAYYNHIDKVLWTLFDACGPEREVSMGNPYPRPTE
jgi:hypothetical protein